MTSVWWYHPRCCTGALWMGNRLHLGNSRKRKTGHGRTTQRFVLEKLHLHTRLNRPVISFAWVILWPFLFDECLVQTQIMANAILPTRITVLVIRKGVRNPFVYLCQGQTPVRRSEYRHPDKRRVAVWRLCAIIFNRWHVFGVW